MKKNRVESMQGIPLLLICAIIYTVTFWLYRLPVSAALYPTILCGFMLSVVCGIRYVKYRKKRKTMEYLRAIPDDILKSLSVYQNADDLAYQELLKQVMELRGREQEELQKNLTDSMDYYTAWVHQIKTPIAAMRLRLEQEDSSFSRGISEDLLRIEQYVEMVLTYQRLCSDSTDYVFRETDLNGVVRAAVRKFAAQFIGKGIRLNLQVPEQKVLTDEKWLSFVLEQILSNALKYTPEGSVTICWKEEGILCIRDTGIGIAPEDLPRIFEKGYTGYNGRLEKRASGLGLFLSKKICDNLGTGITASSVAGEGTEVCLIFDQKKYRFE